MKVLVLMGGVSPERDVSLDTGKAVSEALARSGNEVVLLDTGAGTHLPQAELARLSASVKPDPPTLMELAELDRQSTLKSVTAADLRDRDVVFNALHGGAGEDGTIQALLDLSGVPYTGSKVLASAVAMDKDISKKIFRFEGIPTPDWMIVRSDEPAAFESVIRESLDKFGLPVIVKPSDQGSTVGLSLVKEEAGILPAVKAAAAISKKVMIEQYIAGRELTVGVLGEKALPVVEILPSHELYDYECKYTTGKCDYVVPAKIDEALADELQANGLKAFVSLRCEGYARVDFRLDETQRPFCLEVNTLPGMTVTSLVPKAAKAMGIGFDELIERICRLAIEGQESA